MNVVCKDTVSKQQVFPQKDLRVSSFKQHKYPKMSNWKSMVEEASRNPQFQNEEQ